MPDDTIKEIAARFSKGTVETKKEKILSWLFYLAIALILTLTAIGIMEKSKESRDHYVVTLIGPIKVNKKVESGYKVIGRYKLWNPSPLKFNFEELDSIRALLPVWLKETYPEEAFHFDPAPTSFQLKDKLNYKFTMLEKGHFIEIDFYRLVLSDGKRRLSLFIGKGCRLDYDRGIAVNVLAYPFHTEEWEKQFSDKRLFRVGDLW